MKISSKDLRVREGDEVNLEQWATIVKPMYKSEEQYEERLREHVAQLLWWVLRLSAWWLD
jgi:hypothetical protein